MLSYHATNTAVTAPLFYISQYLDPIIAATWSEDGAVHDVCKALSPRFREPNVIVSRVRLHGRHDGYSSVVISQVVFKALIVLHTMIRNGATDNVLAYLSSSDVLRLRNVSAGNWEGQLSTLGRLGVADVQLAPSQATTLLRIFKTTLHTWTLAYVHTANSNMMQSECNPKIIEICAIRRRSRMTERRKAAQLVKGARLCQYNSHRQLLYKEARQ